MVAKLVSFIPTQIGMYGPFCLGPSEVQVGTHSCYLRDIEASQRNFGTYSLPAAVIWIPPEDLPDAGGLCLSCFLLGSYWYLCVSKLWPICLSFGSAKPTMAYRAKSEPGT